MCVALPTGYNTYTLSSGAIIDLTCDTGYYLVRIGGGEGTPNSFNCA